MSRTATARTIITDALGTIGVAQAGEPLSAEDAILSLRILNDLIDSYVINDLTMLTVDRVTHLITANQATYTIGPVGADIILDRPVEIDNAGVILNFGTTSENEIPLVFLTDDAYAAIRVKNLTNGIPTQIYYSPTIAGGLGTITLYPTPTDAGNYFAIYVNTQTPQFANLSTSLVMAPGYARMFKWNLGLELANYFTVPASVTQIVRENAIGSMKDVKRTNVKVMDLSLDPGITGGTGQSGWYNINTDLP
jgi:hypothetical protein